MKERAFDSIYAQPSGMVIACSCATIVAWTCAILSGLHSLHAMAWLFTLIAACRVITCLFYSYWLGPNGRERCKIAVVMIALAYSVCAGALGMAVLLSDASHELAVLAVGYVMVYATATSVRSASRPTVATVQALLSLGPVFIACLVVGSPAMLILALILPGLAYGMRALTVGVHGTLMEQVEIAEGYRNVSRQLREQALRDPLTDLCNREGLEPALAAQIEAVGPKGKIALMWIDLHNLKSVNETLGYVAGDSLLREMARRMTRVAPEGSVLARFASDEFILAAPVSSRDAAENFVEKACEEFNRPTVIAETRVECGTSMGVAILGEDVEDMANLMRAADVALLNAKANGRNQICFYTPELTLKRAQRKELENDLRLAMTRGELAIYFQPLIDLRTGKIRCFEALVRWFHPEKGEIPPDKFIPVAEETGQIITLGNWITLNAARAAANWPAHVSLAVNLSTLQIRAPGAALGILNAVKTAGLDPSRLELEVTESLFLEDCLNTRLFMEHLSDAGVKFAMDDFGTGYSSLNYIQKYPFSKIKMDRSFVSGPNIDHKSDAIVRAVADMGVSLGMEIVAEGIETMEQVQKVSEAGCTLGQGYYFSRAVPDHVAAHLLLEEQDEFGTVRKAG